MLGLNGLYLAAVLQNTPFLIPIQAAIALFKYAWIKLIASVSMSGAVTLKEQRSLNMFLLSLQVFSFVVAPCIATAVSDSNCFYELFDRQPAQAGTSYGQCSLTELVYVDGSYKPECVSKTGLTSLAQPFYPPFVYHYQCSSALIINYVPVLLFMFVFGSVGTPTVVGRR